VDALRPGRSSSSLEHPAIATRLPRSAPKLSDKKGRGNMKRDFPYTAATANRIRKHEGGYTLEGPGFYVWDEDRDEVLRAARDLRCGALRVSSTTRFLVIPAQETNGNPD